MATVERRRSRRDSEETDERDERPTRRRRDDDEGSEDRAERPSRRRRGRDEDEEDEKPRRSRRSSSRRDDEDEDDAPKRSRRSTRSRSRGDDEDESPRRRRGRSSEDSGGRSKRRGTSGFGSYSSKKVSSGGGDFAEDFKVKHNTPTLIKILDAEPFDSYNQHWIDDMPQGERKSYVCLDDEEYFVEDEYLNHDGECECPLCQIGEKPKTFALFNVIDLSNPRKPEVKVWSASPAVADYLERASKEKKTSPINREDVYWEVELTKKGKRYQWVLTPIKARDLPEDFDVDPLEPDEIEEFENDRHDDRSAVTKIDTYDDLADLADDLMK